MRKLATILATLLFLIAMAPAASAGGNGWHGRDWFGSVKVSSDRRHITVCNTSNDGSEVWAEYATSFLLMHTVKDKKGGDCEKDTVIFGYITVFKLCIRRNGLKECNPSIWIKR
ncbi:hypothetical protein [Microtetraspora malaysiensis]|uniref:Uncharacterized protein n=1 Tax=Microtetraspora malaysiensis TaxID=161358 RepID=A0ABW6SR50_9ACTN